MVGYITDQPLTDGDTRHLVPKSSASSMETDTGRQLTNGVLKRFRHSGNGSGSLPSR